MTKRILTFPRSLTAAWILLGALSLAACGGGSGGDGDASPDPTGPLPEPEVPGVVVGTCTNSANSPVGVNTCFELERIGGLTLSFIELTSIAMSSTYDRAITVLMANAPLPCPVAGTVRASSPRLNEILLSYQACDFGLGGMTGTVLASDARDDAQRARGDAADRADLTIDVVSGARRYQFVGEASDVFDIGVDVGGQGSVTVGTQTPLPVTVAAFGSRVAGSTTLQRGTLSSSHGTPGQASASLFAISAQTEFSLTPVGALFERASAPSSGGLRYTRSSSPGAGQVTTTGDLAVAAAGFQLPLRNVISGGQESIAAQWNNVIARPRYEFAQ